jgi:hypothetical protein
MRNRRWSSLISMLMAGRTHGPAADTQSAYTDGFLRGFADGYTGSREMPPERPFAAALGYEDGCRAGRMARESAPPAAA